MGGDQPSTAAECLRFASLFEAEVLTALILERWSHPRAGDRNYALQLVEQAGEVLRQSAAGTQFIESVPAPDMNFIAAVWYVEWAAAGSDPGVRGNQAHQTWLEAVRRTFPSCFCDPDDLL